MSPDEDALLNGIAADPAADLPRLVYADWLEEHGQELRAEFIRVQCEIAKLEVGPRDVIDRNVHLWRRQQELLDGHMGELTEGVPSWKSDNRGSSQRFRRGFIDEVRLDQSEFGAFGDGLARLRPLPASVALTVDATRIKPVNDSSNAARGVVTELAFQGYCDEDMDPLSVTIAWPRLQILSSLFDIAEIDDLVDILRDSMPSLKILNMTNHRIDDCNVINLLNAGVLQRLSHISLIENAIGDQAALELADRLGDSPNLKELDLRRNGITAVGQAALLARLGSKVILF